MTKEEFKKLWEADEKGSGITFDDIADRAKEWGLFDKPKCCDINIVRYEVLKAAKCVDVEEFNPNNENWDMNLQEDYCSSEVSKLLREKGFKCGATYSKGFVKDGDGFVGGLIRYEDKITHQMAMKWLRERHVIIVIVPAYFNGEQYVSWDIDIWVDDNYHHIYKDFPTFEEAVEAALKYCLTELI